MPHAFTSLLIPKLGTSAVHPSAFMDILATLFLWSPSLKSFGIQAPLGGRLYFNLSETLGISDIGKRAAHVRAENNPMYVLVHA